MSGSEDPRKWTAERLPPFPYPPKKFHEHFIAFLILEFQPLVVNSFCIVPEAGKEGVGEASSVCTHACTHQQIKSGSGKIPFSSESHIKQCLN